MRGHLAYGGLIYCKNYQLRNTHAPMLISTTTYPDQLHIKIFVSHYRNWKTTVNNIGNNTTGNFTNEPLAKLLLLVLPTTSSTARLHLVD